jgi:Alcohol dehydrogenase GroES-like domain
MRGVILHAPGDVRVEQREDPKIEQPTDAIIRLAATCVCGSDLWPYRGIEPVGEPAPMGHEYAGVVEEAGSDVQTIKPGQFVIGSFFASDNTCEICQAGYQSSCVHRVPMGSIGTQAELARIPLADGTLVATSQVPSDDLVPSLLAASDVLGTGWFGAVAADVQPGKTVAVVGDGAVGLLAVLAARQPPWRPRRLRRRCPRCRAAWYGAVLLPRAPARRPGPSAPLPARPDRADLQPGHRPGPGLRPDPAAGPSPRGVPRHGRAPRDQDPATPLTGRRR